MRLSTIITALSTAAFSALVLAAPSAVTFTSTGTPETGFTIPKDAPDGVYSTTYENGVPVHTWIADSAQNTGNSSAASTASGSAVASANGKAAAMMDGYVVCAGYELNHDEVNGAVEALAQACGDGYWVYHRYHFWAKSGSTVAFICNHSFLYDRHCTYWTFRNWMVLDIGGACGAWMGGWINWDDYWQSAGQHWVDSNINFCGSSHDGKA